MNTQLASKDDPAISPLARRAAAVCDWFANLSKLQMLAVAIGALAFLGAIAPSGESAPSPQETSRIQAWSHAAVTVERHMFTPRLAETGSFQDKASGAELTPDGARAWGMVDGYHRLGNTVRYEWAAKLQPDGGKWKVAAMKIGDRWFGIKDGDTRLTEL